MLAAADLVAVPQLDTEAGRHQMPMKVYDAMAMARPIVATSVSDLPDVLDGCGLLVPPGEVHALTGAIDDLLSQPDEASRLGAAARARCAARYSIGRVGEALAAVVDQVLA